MKSPLRTTALAVTALAAAAYVSVGLADATPSDESPSTGRAAAPGQSSAVARAVPAVDIAGDPGELVFSSYLGGQEWDEATGVAADSAGNTYVTGFTLSRDFPTVGPDSRRHDAIVDAFVTKVDAAAGRIVWSTHLGGVDLDSATAVTVDDAGNIYVVGRTGSPDFPTSGGLQDQLNGQSCTGVPCHDAFVVKLDPTGGIVWSTLYGGTLNEEAVSVAVDDAGAVYVAGLTDSPDLPVRQAVPGEVPEPAVRGRPALPLRRLRRQVRSDGRPARLQHLPRRRGLRPGPRHRRGCRRQRLRGGQHPVDRLPHGARLPVDHARPGLRAATRRAVPTGVPHQAQPQREQRSLQHLPGRPGARRRLRGGRRPTRSGARDRRDPVTGLPRPQRHAADV